MAFVLLLAALAHPTWAVAHAVVHEHLAQHHGEAPPHTPASAPEPHEAGTQPLASPDRSHDHEHDHLLAVFVRPTRSADSPSHAALPSATPLPRVIATRQWSVPREAAPSRASPEASGPSDPRAPPIT